MLAVGTFFHWDAEFYKSFHDDLSDFPLPLCFCHWINYGVMEGRAFQLLSGDGSVLTKLILSGTEADFDSELRGFVETRPAFHEDREPECATLPTKQTA